MIVSKMAENHIKPVLSIEGSSFKHPWSKISFIHELSDKHAYNFVLTTNTKPDTQLIAYLCMREIIDEVHILKIAVKPVYRGKGFGYRLLNDGLQFAAQHQIQTAFLEVRPSNIAGLLLYRKVGFQVIGKRPKYYADTGEDAIIMTKLL